MAGRYQQPAQNGGGKVPHGSPARVAPFRALARGPTVWSKGRTRSPGSVRLAQAFGMLGRQPGSTFLDCDRQGRYARGCARRSSPACEPRAAALAVAPFARLELAREGHASGRHTGQPGMPSEKVAVSPFFSSRPVSRVQSRVVRQCFQIGEMSFDQGWTCKRYTSLKSLCTPPECP